VKVGELFQSRFLRADDLGRSHVRVTIEKVAIEAMHGSRKPVLYFRGKSKGLVVNQTRARSLTKVLATDETEAWVGCQVSLYVDSIETSDETTGRKRRVQMICVDERPESALRPRRDGEPATGPLTAADVKRW